MINKTPRLPMTAGFSVLPALTLAFAAAPARADAPPRSEKQATAPSSESSLSPVGWRLLGGVGTGIGSTDTLTGSQTILSARLAHQWTRWVAEAGVGWSYSYFGGDDGGGRATRIVLRQGIAEASPRYRVTDRWQLGPLAYAAFGTDTSLRPNVGASEGNVFAGLRSVYELSVGKYPIHFWQQAATDLSFSGRQYLTAMVGLHIGLPFGGPRAPTEVAEAPPAPAAAPRDSDSIRASSAAPSLRIELDPQKVFFNTNSTRLRPQVESVLRSVGKHLEKNAAGWDSVEIAGHADRRGRYEYNLKLSRQRAEQVRREILEGGADASRLEAKGFSYEYPLDPSQNPRAWSRNRRVEIVFNKIDDPRPLVEMLSPLSIQGPEAK